MKKYKTIHLDTGVRVTQHTVNGITYISVSTNKNDNETRSRIFTIIELAITAILLTIAVFTAKLFF